MHCNAEIECLKRTVSTVTKADLVDIALCRVVHKASLKFQERFDELPRLASTSSSNHHLIK